MKKNILKGRNFFFQVGRYIMYYVKIQFANIQSITKKNLGLAFILFHNIISVSKVY